MIHRDGLAGYKPAPRYNRQIRSGPRRGKRIAYQSDKPRCWLHPILFMMFNPFRYFRSAKPGTSGSLRSQPAAHMTWASASVSRTMSRTGLFLKRQIWLWPIFATVLLAALGFGVRRAIESTIKESLRSQMQALLNVETAMLENWFKTQSSIATSLANEQQVRENVLAML